MHIIVERPALIAVINRAVSIVETKKSIPILGHVVISSGDRRVTMTATDLDMDVSDTAPADVAAPGVAAVPGPLLAEIARKTSGAEIALRLDPSNGFLTITSGKATFKLPTLPAEDFPTTHDLGVIKASFVIEPARFLDLLKTTRHAMSTELSRHYLRGVYVHGHSSTTLRAVATNGHVLALRDCPAPPGAGQLDGLLLPAKLVNALPKIIDAAHADTLDVAVSGVKVQFKMGTLTVTSKLIEGTFPDYVRILPKDPLTVMTADASTLSDAVDRVGAVSKVGIGLHVNGTLQITGRGTDGGTAEDSIDVTHDGPNLSIGFSAAYISETLKHIGGDSIWGMTDAGAPVSIRDSADDTTMFVLMPMRL